MRNLMNVFRIYKEFYQERNDENESIITKQC